MSSSTVSLYREVMEKADTAPLGQVLRLALRLARELGNEPFEKWVRLEIDGYFRDTMSKDDKVPEYRAVSGRYRDVFGRLGLTINPAWAFLNEYRLRQGVEVLEKLESGPDPVVIEDDNVLEKIRELNPNVRDFILSTASLSEALAGVRSRLSDWLDEIRLSHPEFTVDAPTPKRDDKTGSGITINRYTGPRIDTGGGAYIAGGVDTGGGDFAGRDQHKTIGLSATEVVQLFEKLYAAVDARPNTSPTVKEDLKTKLKEVQAEVAKAGKADEAFLARRLRNIGRMAPDILEVMIATFANRAAGLGLIAKKVADKMKEAVGKDSL